ncbi:DUF4249 domain-containing protein [Robertkochia solimangrovi]|uniref:DUF4249 domain-containing protein n=1 Tax=Robertkochia solimangrovi TaxID=2213046 RepID=UPI00117FC82B|nr:DUF4249 domain-containing protein [Robertkochia solimangrovi]TRZ41960.1 hypothetical protein DMZ48_15085 [Robertkochia solimangrovi]
MTQRLLKYRIYRKVTMIALFGILGCVKPFPTETLDFEDMMVVEATITNEEKTQQIFLSRTYPLEIDSIIPESGAAIQITGGEQIYTFSESSPGVYISDQEFGAQPETEYQLQITKNGNTYHSNNVRLPQVTRIDGLKAESIVDENGEAMAIFVDSYDPTGNSRNYRYEYVETFRIVAPYYREKDLIVPNENSCGVELVNDEWSVKECFMTDYSNTIIQYSTSNLTDDNVERFMVRRIAKDNFIIAHRYSILVRQFVQTNEAFAYYEALHTFSGQESVFSGSQPGFLQGNITSDTNPDEKIVGYFDISSVSKKRIFFNYNDFFNGNSSSSYTENCDSYAPLISEGNRCFLSELINFNAIRYLEDNKNYTPGLDGPYRVVPRICGDCSVVGEVETPDFWIE